MTPRCHFLLEGELGKLLAECTSPETMAELLAAAELALRAAGCL